MQSNWMAWLPYPVRRSRKLSPAAKLLFAELTSFADKDGRCKVSNAELMEITETTERTVTRQLNELKTAQFIDIFQRGPERFLTIVFAKKNAKADYEEGRQKCLPKVDKNVYQRWTKMSTNTLYSLSTKVDSESDTNESAKQVHLNSVQAEFTAPTLEQVVGYAEMHGISKDTAIKFFNNYEAINWEIRPGVFLRKWQFRLANWKLEDKLKQEKEAARQQRFNGAEPAPMHHESKADKVDEVQREKMKALYGKIG